MIAAVMMDMVDINVGINIVVSGSVYVVADSVVFI
jgi:hypothetical protein